MSCPNKNLPEYKKLESELGEIPALAAWHMHQNDGKEGIPTITEAKSLLSKPDDSSRDSELTSKIKSTMEKIGVSVKMLDSLKDKDGKPLSAIAKADLLNKTIEVVEGRADLSTLPEEAAHFFVEMLPVDSPVLKQMMDQITSYKLYKGVVDQYINNPAYRKGGKPDFDKIKKEAIGKLIALNIIQEQAGDESIEKQQKAVSWFRQLWNWIASKLGALQENPFAKMASDIKEGNTDNLDLKKSLTGEYFQLDGPINKLLTDQGRINLDNSIDARTGQKRHIYYIDGKPAKGSVTSVYVDKYYKRLFPNDISNASMKELNLLKAEYGDAIHSDVQSIFETLVDPKTGEVRSTQLSLGQTKSPPEVVAKLSDFIQSLIKTYDPGTKFLTEMKIFDAKNNIAGSIDLVAIRLDGTVDIYDWKSQEIHDGQTEVKEYKVGAYRIQLERYRDILKNDYGFKKFGTIRAYPIRTMYNKGGGSTTLKDIEIGDINPNKIYDNQRYLLPITLKEEKSGDELVDQQIAKLNTLLEYAKKKVYKLTGDDRARQQLDVDRIGRVIEDLHVRGSLDSYANLANAYLNKYLQGIKDDTMTSGDVLEASMVNDAVFMNTANAFQTKIEELNKQIDAEKDPVKQKQLTDLKTKIGLISSNANIVDKKLNAQIEKIGLKVADINGITDLLRLEPNASFSVRWLNHRSDQSFKTIQTFNRMCDRQQDMRNLKINAMFEKLNAIKKSMESWANGKALSGKNMWNGILEFNKDGKFAGRLLSKHTDEFRAARDKATIDQNLKWFVDNTTFDQKAYDLADEKRLKLYEDSHFSDDPVEQKRMVEEKINSWRRFNSVQVGNKLNFTAYANRNNPFLKINSNWESAKWKELQKDSNKPLKEAYDYFQQLLQDSEDLGIIHRDEHNDTFMPAMANSPLEKIAFGTADFKDIMQTFNIFHRTNVNDERYAPELNPLTNDADKKVQTFFKRDIGKEMEDGSKDYTDMSTDLLKVFSTWGIQTHTFEGLSSIEDDALLLVALENGKSIIGTNKNGVIGKDEAQIHGPLRNTNKEILDMFVKNKLYHETNEMWGIKDKVIELPKALGGGKFSAIKVVKIATQNMVFRTLALNISSGTAHLIRSVGNVFIQSGKPGYFTEHQWAEALYQHASLNKKASALMHHFGVEIDQEHDRKARNQSSSNLVKYGSYDAFAHTSFSIIKNADLITQHTIAKALCLSHMIVDGKVVEIEKHVQAKNDYGNFYNLNPADRKTVQEKIDKEVGKLTKSKSIFHSSTMKDGKIEIPGLDRNSVESTRFLSKMQKITKKAIGNMSYEDLNLIRTSVLGTSLMSFRSWLPGMIESRFGGYKEDIDTNEHSIGRYNLLFRNLISKRAIPTLTTMIGMFGDSGIESAKAAYQLEKARNMVSGKCTDDEGANPFMGESEFIDMYKGSLKSMFKELSIILGFMGMFGLVSHWAQQPDKDKGLREYVARIVQKYYSGFSFFLDPREFENLWNNTVPAIGVLTDGQKFLGNLIGKGIGYAEGDEKGIKANHPLKYGLKFLPFGQQGMTYWASMDADFRKEWNIHLSEAHY